MKNNIKNLKIYKFIRNHWVVTYICAQAFVVTPMALVASYIVCDIQNENELKKNEERIQALIKKYNPFDEEDIDTDIKSIKEAEATGYLIPNPTKEQLLEAINHNRNITKHENIREIFVTYVSNFCDRFPNLDKAALLKNLESLQIEIQSGYYMSSIHGANVQANFSPASHLLEISQDFPENGYSLILNHEISHMVRNVSFETKDGKFALIQFKHNGFGNSIDEEIITLLTNEISFNWTSYPVENAELLADCLGDKELLFENYLHYDIYSLQTALDFLNPEISAYEFITCSDQQAIYQHFGDATFTVEQEIELYTNYIDYFYASHRLEVKDHFEEILESLDISPEAKNSILEHWYSKQNKVYQK